MFGLFGKSRDGLTKEERSAKERRDERYSDAMAVLAAGIRNSNTAQMAEGVNLMHGLIKDYPDFPKPYVRLIQFSLKAGKFELAKDMCVIVQDRFSDDPDVKLHLESWCESIDNNKEN